LVAMDAVATNTHRYLGFAYFGVAFDVLGKTSRRRSGDNESKSE